MKAISYIITTLLFVTSCTHKHDQVEENIKLDSQNIVLTDSHLLIEYFFNQNLNEVNWSDSEIIELKTFFDIDNDRISLGDITHETELNAKSFRNDTLEYRVWVYEEKEDHFSLMYGSDGQPEPIIKMESSILTVQIDYLTKHPDYDSLLLALDNRFKVLRTDGQKTIGVWAHLLTYYKRNNQIDTLTFSRFPKKTQMPTIAKKT